MAGTPRSAVNANVRIGATVFYGASWNVKENPEILDTSNFEGGGFSDAIPGMYTVNVDVEGFFDASQNPFDSPPLLGAGSILSTVKLYLNTVSGPFWLFPVVLITSTETSAEAKGSKPLWFKFSFQNKGSWTEPTGAA